MLSWKEFFSDLILLLAIVLGPRGALREREATSEVQGGHRGRLLPGNGDLPRRGTHRRGRQGSPGDIQGFQS